MSAHEEIGPTALPRWRVYNHARELQALAQQAVELSIEGPKCDVPRALGIFDRMRSILGCV